MGFLSTMTVLLTVLLHQGALTFTASRLSSTVPARSVSPRLFLGDSFKEISAFAQWEGEQLQDSHKVLSSGTPRDEESGEALWAWQLCLLGITACWGANFATTKFALDTLQASVDGGGALFVAARFLVGAAALVPFLFSASSGPAVWAGVRVGALCALGYGSQSAALAMGASAGTAAFICSLQSVVVAVIASRTAGVPPHTWAAIALSIAGVGSLESASLVEAATSAGPVVGPADVIALGQPLGFGLSYVVLERAMKEHPDDELSLAALQCAVIAAAATAAASIGGHAAPWELPWSALLPQSDGSGLGVTLAVLYTSLISTSLTIWLQAKVFKRVPSTDASLILATEPVWATGFAVLLLGDTVESADLVGGALILAALVCNQGLLGGGRDVGLSGNAIEDA